MNTDPKLSATYCGCDPGANHQCERHAAEWRENETLHGLGPSPEQRQALISRAEAIAIAVNEVSERLKSAHPADQKQWRKQRPLYSGVLAYFPKALMEVAHVSWLGNEQHNPGEPLHWAREKSTDHTDCIARHLADHSLNPVDTDGGLHLAKCAWRALAALELYLEGKSK